MNTRVRATDYELTPKMSAYLDERLVHVERMLGEEGPGARCEVEVGRDAGRPRHGKNIWFAEIQISYPGQQGLRATNHSESINGAIDDAKEELVRQIRNQKRLHTRILRRSGAIAKRLLRMG